MFLFGRVPVDAAQANGETVSACAVVHNMQRCVFFVPGRRRSRTRRTRSPTSRTPPRARAAGRRGGGRRGARRRRQEGKGALLRCLQGRAAEVKGEVREMLLARGIETFSMKPVKRSYCFEREDIPRGAQYVLKVRYPRSPRRLAERAARLSWCALGTRPARSST